MLVITDDISKCGQSKPPQNHLVSRFKSASLFWRLHLLQLLQLVVVQAPHLALACRPAVQCTEYTPYVVARRVTVRQRSANANATANL